LLVLVGVRSGDARMQADKLVRKLLALRVFEDADCRMNLALADVGGEVLCVSNFTLYADTRKGKPTQFPWTQRRPRRPSRSTRGWRRALERRVGRFGRAMAIELVNDGPVTLLIDT